MTSNTSSSSPRTSWGAPKRCRSLSLTDEAWTLLTRLSESKGQNRSETLEQIIRIQTGVELPS